MLKGPIQITFSCKLSGIRTKQILSAQKIAAIRTPQDKSRIHTKQQSPVKKSISSSRYTLLILL